MHEVLLEAAKTVVVPCRPEDVDEAEAKERCSLWRALAKLLLLLPPPLPNALHAALPEDWQLRAFAPLTAAHSSLEFGQPLSDQVGAHPACYTPSLQPLSASSRGSCPAASSCSESQIAPGLIGNAWPAPAELLISHSADGTPSDVADCRHERLGEGADVTPSSIPDICNWPHLCLSVRTSPSDQ